MAKQISLNLTINGVKQNIKSINDLEKAIAGAQEELKGLEIGSEQFKKLTTDVNNAKSAFKDLEKSFEGQELEQRVGAFAKLGEGITASFAGAQAAIALFGGESEAVAEAAAQAQSVLTIALAARSAAESVVAVRTVAANIATFASAAAANAANVATKALWTTLAANPYGAIIAVIGLLVTALVTLTGKQKEQIDVQKELISATSNEANALKQQLTILTKYTGLKNLQKKTIEDLKKEYPGFNAFLDKENRLTQDGIKFLQLKIKQYELESRAKLLVQKISETNIQLLELENTNVLENLSFWQQAWNALRSGGNITAKLILDAKTAAKNQKEALDEIKKSQDVYIKAFEKLNVEINDVYGELEVYNKTLKDQVKEEEAAAEALKNQIDLQKRISDARKEGLTALIDYSNALAEYTKANKKYEEELARILKGDYTSNIIQDLEEIKKLRIESINELKTASDSFIESINKLNKIPVDQFINNFAEFKTKLQEEFKKGSNNFNQIAADFIKNQKNLTQEQQVELLRLAQSYTLLSEQISKTPGFDLIVKSLKDFKTASGESVSGFDALNALFQETAIELGILKKEFDDVGNVTNVILDPIKAGENADKLLQILKDRLLIPTEIELAKQEIARKQREKRAQEDLSKNANATKAQQENALVAASKLGGEIDNLNMKVVELSGNLTSEEALKRGLISEKTKEAVDATTQSIIKNGVAITQVEQKYIDLIAQVQKLNKELTPEQAGRAVAGELLRGIEQVSNILLGARTKAQLEEQKIIEQAKADEEGLLKFRQDLIAKGIDVSNTTNADLLASYTQFKLKEAEVNKQVEEEKRAEAKKTSDEIAATYELAGQAIGKIAEITQLQTKVELDKIELERKNALDRVVGDSQAAADKRIEIDKQYNEKKKQVEKEGQITALKLTLAQTVANTAAATVRAFSDLGPIAGAIFAALNAGLLFTQISNIQTQIASVQALRRGGLIKQKMAAGGMLLSGPSHENGGIPLAQYGVIAEGQEAVINRQSTVNYRDLLSSVNQIGGGRPLVVNNFDDSRIVEAIAEQKQLPLRAYVLQSEITNEQAISKRLDDLSKI